MNNVAPKTFFIPNCLIKDYPKSPKGVSMSTEVETLMKVDSHQAMKEDIEQVSLMLADRLDFLDVQILRKFYVTGKEFPFDTQPYCFPILYREMKVSNRLKICREAFRKRMETLVRHGFLIKMSGTNPVNYTPVKGKEALIRAVVTKFFLIHGLTKFM